MNLDNDINLLYEIGSWRHIHRLWEQHFHDGHMENDVEHTFRVLWLALVIARYEGEVDEGKLLKMALIHDLPEIRGGDQSIVQKLYVTVVEETAVKDTLDGTSLENLLELHKEYKERKSKEARIVKDADNLEPDFELAEKREAGSNFGKLWADQYRPRVKEKLYTQTAKRIFERIYSGETSPHTWFLKKNKFTEQSHHSE